MSYAFATPYDIANRALQHCGVTLISTFDDGSRNSDACSFVYDKVRRAELRRNPWNCTARRTALRPLVPGTASSIVIPTWNGATTYQLGDIVFSTAAPLGATGGYFVSQRASNQNQTPAAGPYWWAEWCGASFFSPWVTNATYYGGELVYSAGQVFEALSTTNAQPVYPGTPPWYNPQGLTLAEWFPPYPLGLTTNSLGTPKNVFGLPVNYLRPWPQDAKRAATSAQTVTAGMQFQDFEIEAGLIFSAAPGPIIFRFGADIVTVPLMDDLLCEVVAARMAMELVETLTQSKSGLQLITQKYNSYVQEAIETNAIEAGSTEPASQADVKTNRNQAIAKPPAPQQGQQ